MRTVFVLLMVLLLGPSLYSQEADSVYEEDFSELEEPTSESRQESSTVHTLVKPDELKSTKSYQEQPMHQKSFDEGQWRSVVGDENFEEAKRPPPEFQMPSLSWGGDVLKAIAYTIPVALILIILYLIVKNFTYKKKLSKTTLVTGFTPHNFEHIDNLDLSSLLEEAMTSKNYRVAVRIYYLMVLKNLHNGGLIRWEKDKTNRDYLMELFSKGQHYDEVKRLTRSYEEVWYGEYPLPEDVLLPLLGKFENLNRKLSQTASRES